MNKEIFKILGEDFNVNDFKDYVNSKLKNDFNNFVFDLSVSSVCNLNCKHCYIGGNMACEASLSLDEWKILIGDITKYKDTRLNLSGMEIAIYQDAEPLFNYLDILKNNSSFAYGTITNGTGSFEFYDMILNSKIDYLEFSVDGLKYTNDIFRGGGTFDKSVNKILWISKKNNSHIEKISISTTLRNSNIGEYKTLVRYFQSIGLKYFFADPIQPYGYAKQHIEETIIPNQYFMFLHEMLEYISLSENRNEGINLFFCIPEYYIEFALISPQMKEWLTQFTYKGKTLYWEIGNNSMQISFPIFTLPYLQYLTISNDGYVVPTPIHLGFTDYYKESLCNVKEHSIDEVLKNRRHYINNLIDKYENEEN